jgi:hypothetical protein
MAQVVPLSDPGDYKRARQRIRKLWDEGKTEFTTHARENMKKRAIDTPDVWNVIQYGRIIDHSRSSPTANWRYTLSGNAVDGKKVKCVVEINGNLIIVTVIDLRR